MCSGQKYTTTVLLSCVSLSSPAIEYDPYVLATYFHVYREQLGDEPSTHSASILACELSTRVLRRGVLRLRIDSTIVPLKSSDFLK